MTGVEQLAVVAAGFGAGVLTSTVGVASLLSFPVLVAVGLPPVVANASNTVGMTPAGLSGSFGYRRELREHPRVTATVVATCMVGSIVGATLLLALPPGVFEAVVPWLILFTCVLVGAQPRISSRLRQRQRADSVEQRTSMSPIITVFAALTGVYGGYFGAGSGVMMLAVLGLGLDIELRVTNALKTLAVLAANLVAAVIFIFAANLEWAAVGLLAIGSVVGGYVGAHIGRRLPLALSQLDCRRRCHRQRSDAALTPAKQRSGAPICGGIDAAAPATTRSWTSRPGAVSGSLRITEQGEVIAAKYAEPRIAYGNLETLVAATLESTLLDVEGLGDAAGAVVRGARRPRGPGPACICRIGRPDTTPGFVEYFKASTPVSEIGSLNIGSRPTSRRPTTSIADLRAIPWVLAWGQSRVMLPGWYGTEPRSGTDRRGPGK